MGLISVLKIRLIPVLLLKNGLLVRSELFKTHQIIGNPINEVQRFNEWNVDEIIYLDISSEKRYDVRREDHKVKTMDDPLTILEEVSKTCFIPLTWGGNIRTLDDMRQRFNKGADKITLNTAAVQNPDLVTQGARMFGNQAIVISIDVLRHPSGKTEVFINGGRESTDMKPEDWARQVEELGAGEILLQSIDRDGTGRGYDIDTIRSVASAVTIPVIACSGVGRYEQYKDGIRAGASAVAAANIWHFKELSDRNGKRAMAKANINIRY